MKTISLCMIVRDEEKVIKRCLDSVVDLVDEIIIVDTGSTDKTQEIVQSYDKVKLYEQEWVDDFASVRNYSFSKATCDWIFWLDADDVVEKKDCEEIRKIADEYKNGIDGYLFTYVYNHDKKGDPSYVLGRERLIKRTSNPKWEYEVHEYINIASYNIERRHDINIHHWRTLDEITKDSGRNLRIMEKMKEKRKKEPRFLFYHGDELRYVGKFEEAIESYKKYLEVSFFPEEKFKATYYIALCYQSLSKFDECKEYCMKAMRMNYSFAEPYFLLGEIAKTRQSHHEARHWFEICININVPWTSQAVKNELYTWKPLAELEFIYNVLGLFEEARNTCIKLIEHHPDNAGLKADLKIFNIKTKRDIEKIPEVFKINLGSGGQKMEGFVSCDLYDPTADLKIDMKELPFPDRSVDEIYSEHALEHLYEKYAHQALEEMKRVLKPFGKLTLKVPDLKRCCEKYIETINNLQSDWYLWTIYGRQVTDDEIDYGQFHYTGFNKTTLEVWLGQLGFKILKSELYDGYQTPSLHIEAMRKGILGWFAKEEDIDSGTVRIRRLNIHKFLLESDSDITTRLITEQKEVFDCDFVVFTNFGEYIIKLAKQLKEKGIKCLYDHNEALLGFPMVDETLAEMDLVICCSTELAKLTSKINPNVIIIEDAVEKM